MALTLRTALVSFCVFLGFLNIARAADLSFDLSNRLVRESVQTQNGDALIQRMTLDPDGKAISVTDELNTTTGIAYDPFERIQTVTNPDGSTTSYSYTDRDEVSSVTLLDPQQNVVHSTAYTYSDHGEVSHTTETLGAGTAPVDTDIFYNSQGKPTLKVGLLGHLSFVNYDGLGRPKGEIDAVGNGYENTYDTGNDVIVVKEIEKTSGADEVFTTNRTFDALGRQLTTTDPGGHLLRTEWDEAGHAVATTDPLGNRTAYVFDGAGRRTQIQAPEGRTTSFSYDGDGLLTDETDGSSNRTHFDLDEAGRRTKLTYMDGAFESWAYNSDGTVRAHTNASGYTEAFTYDAKDRVSRINIANPAGVAGPTYEAFSYDPLDRITHEETDSLTGNGQPEITVDRTYGNGGSLGGLCRS